MRTINFNYDHLGQPEYAEKVDFIIFSLSNNPNYPTMPVAVADITTKKAAWIGKLELSKQGNHVATEQAKVLRQVLDTMIKDNGIYINKTANGDVAMLQSSGYDLSKERVYTPNAEVQVIQSDMPGAGKIVINPVEGAYAYLIFWSSDPIPDPVNEKVCTRLAMTTKHYQWVTGVISGKDNWLIYYTVGVNGESVMKGPFHFKLL